MAPASASVPTTPATARFAAATKLLPGPVTTSTGSSPRLGDTVRERADRAGAAHGVHLFHAQEPGCGEDDGVYPPAVRALRRRREGDLRDTGDLGGDDVHDDAGGIDGLAAGHVEPDPSHRLPPLQHAGAGADLGHRGRRNLRGGCPPDARDRLLERGPNLRIKAGEGFLEVCRGDADVVVDRSVELLGLLAQRGLAERGDIRDEGRRSGQCLFAGGGGTRHDGQEFCRREGATAQIDRAEHLLTVSRSATASQPRITPDTSCR